MPFEGTFVECFYWTQAALGATMLYYTFVYCREGNGDGDVGPGATKSTNVHCFIELSTLLQFDLFAEVSEVAWVYSKRRNYKDLLRAQYKAKYLFNP